MAEKDAIVKPLLQVPLSSIILKDTKKDDEVKKGKQRNGITDDKVKDLLKDRTEKLNDAEGIMELHPDLRLARDLLISQILSPKDLGKAKLRLAIDKSIYADSIPAELLDTLTGYFKRELNLEKRMPKILGEALFDKGSYIQLFLPPSEIDTLVNAGQKGISMESVDDEFRRIEAAPISLIKANEKADGEKTSLSQWGVTEIVGNFNILKEPHFRKKAREEKRNSFAMESLGENSRAGRLFKKKELLRIGVDDTINLGEGDEVDKTNKANAIEIVIPADCYLPVHAPNDPSQHIGGFVPVDEHGYFTSKAKNSDYAGELQKKLKKAMEATTGQKAADPGYLVVKGELTDEEKGGKRGDIDLDDFMDEYYNHIEAPIKRALIENDLVDGESIDLKGNDEFYKIILSRALTNQKTKLVFVPSEFVSYIAFEHNALGHGVGLLEKTRFYSSLRAILQIADMMNAVQNSVPETDLEITLDEEDMHPEETIETIMHELAKLTATNFPIGSNSPSDIITSLQKAAFRLNIEGGTVFPNTKISRQDVQKNKARIDSDLNETVTNKLFNGIGMPYEIVQQTLEGQTATEVLTRDKMLTKRALEKQEIFSDQFAAMIRKYTLLSDHLYAFLLDALKSDDKVELFLDALYCAFPTADHVDIESQLESFELKRDQYTEAIGQIISDDAVRGILGNTDVARDVIEDFRNILVGHYMREWMDAEGIMPELSNIFSDDKDLQVHPKIGEHYTKLFKVFSPILKKMLKAADKFDTAANKAMDGGEDDDQGGGYGDSQGFGTPFNDEGQNPFSFGDDQAGQDSLDDITPPEPEPEPDPAATDDPIPDPPASEDPEEDDVTEDPDV